MSVDLANAHISVLRKNESYKVLAISQMVDCNFCVLKCARIGVPAKFQVYGLERWGTNLIAVLILAQRRSEILRIRSPDGVV